MNNFTPAQIVQELDRYIIGQHSAKRAVAVALRNRYRRSKLPQALREEITPKNIIMQGPTGVGKTEIARRLAKLVKAPFVKVEATKFTEVGYVGRDVESMVRDLVEASIRMVKEEKSQEVELRAREMVEEKLIPAIAKKRKEAYPDMSDGQMRGYIIQELREGKLDDLVIDIALPVKPKQQTIGQGNMEININEIFGSMVGGNNGKVKQKTLTVKEATKYLLEMEEEKLIDPDNVNQEAISRAENEGIIFIDEIDKIANKGNGTQGHDVSREGVQRDILPIVEGCTVATKYGNVKTDFILFIASGAFHVSKIEDMIPELQGRFPIRVDLDNLTKEDFKRILSEPKNSVTMQYESILKVDNIDLQFTDDALDEIAEMAATENETSENIGARRLHTIMESLLEDISFNASNDLPMTTVKIDRAYVQNAFKETKRKFDLKKYIL